MRTSPGLLVAASILPDAVGGTLESDTIKFVESRKRIVAGMHRRRAQCPTFHHVPPPEAAIGHIVDIRIPIVRN